MADLKISQLPAAATLDGTELVAVVQSGTTDQTTVAAFTAAAAASSSVVASSDVGTAPNQIPLNQYLGTLAYQDSNAVSISGGVGTFTTLNTTGNVGIGTSSPTTRLHVLDTTVGGAPFRITGANSFSYNFQSLSDGTTDGRRFDINIGSSSGQISFSNSARTLGTFDSSGNLGLGVTPSAWGSLFVALQVSRAGLRGSTATTGLSFNTYYDGSSFRYIASALSALDYYQNSGQHVWSTAPSGTAGNAITFTERASISATEFVVNNPGEDYDFRVESDTNTHALFVEGTNSNVKIGGSAERASTVGTNHLDIFNGTAPVGTLTNGISIYSSAGEAYVMDAAGNATLFSPHDAETNEWIFKSKHTPTGKVLKIDVERLLRFVNDHFGLDAVQEFIEE